MENYQTNSIHCTRSIFISPKFSCCRFSLIWIYSKMHICKNFIILSPSSVYGLYLFINMPLVEKHAEYVTHQLSAKSITLTTLFQGNINFYSAFPFFSVIQCYLNCTFYSTSMNSVMMRYVAIYFFAYWKSHCSHQQRIVSCSLQCSQVHMSPSG